MIVKTKNNSKMFDQAEIPISGYGNIRFDSACSKNAENSEIVSLSLPAIRQYWNEHQINQRSTEVSSYKHNLPFHGCEKSLKSIISAIKQNRHLYPIEVHVGDFGGLCFADGKHRIMLLSLAGYSSIFARVKKSEVSSVLKTVGSSFEDTRLSLF